MEGVSLQDVMKAVSDSKSLDMFHSIAKGDVESKVLKQTGGLSKKQYYSRMRQLLKTGLVQRSKGVFTLTGLGAAVYEAQTVLENGINNYWKLKAIDSIEAANEIGEQERQKR
jgi:predicted transcriptional regulator